MTTPKLDKQATLDRLPPPWTTDLMPEIRQALSQSGTKIVVLDDDPTGTQTVHDVTVLTKWSVDVFVQELNDPNPAMFVLTNTRSMTADQAQTLNKDIVSHLKEASQITGRAFALVSRSDSTLRGHFPAETDALSESLEAPLDAVLIIPAFMAGGRFTINGTHYVAEGDVLTPASDTPFARDAAFGYSTSDMRQWVEEKTNQRISANDVHVIPIDLIRQGGIEGVLAELMKLTGHTYCVLDAITERDLEVIVLAIIHAETAGKHFLYRTAASFASIRAGIALRALLSPAELQTNRDGGGLIVVGSYVPKSSAQLEHLLASGLVCGIEIHANKLLIDEERDAEVYRVIKQVIPYLKSKQTVGIYTSRTLITGESAEDSLAIGNRVSASLVEITSKLQSHARYIIAKGGITSSDLATKALNVMRARVIGQILPGIPVWKLDEECAEPNMIYVVFPGNVGANDAITEAVTKLANP